MLGSALMIGLPSASKWQAYLCYALGDGNQQAMLDTLEVLSSRLERASIETVLSGTIGIAVRKNGVHLKSLPRDNSPITALRTSGPDGICVMALDEGDDPRPLYLLPLDPSIRMDGKSERRDLEERVRSGITSVIGRHLDEPEFEIDRV